MRISVTLSEAEIADYFWQTPAALLETLACLAGDFDDDKAVLRFCDAAAGAHTGSAEEQAVAPFLRTLAGQLFNAEDRMGLRT
jgi:hypothetical protein